MAEEFHKRSKYFTYLFTVGLCEMIITFSQFFVTAVEVQLKLPEIRTLLSTIANLLCINSDENVFPSLVLTEIPKSLRLKALLWSFISSLFESTINLIFMFFLCKCWMIPERCISVNLKTQISIDLRAKLNVLMISRREDFESLCKYSQPVELLCR